ncbi:MAG: hypothetical protein HN856_12090 [Gammaproteobacteria bacterium]|nr:hypothetical protein [Gammaproteobacteria bacterium]
MTGLIIILVLAVVVGPVLYLVPSAKDKRLTALRLAARQLGLSVQMTSVAKLDPRADERVTAGGKHRNPQIACAAYHLPIGHKDVGRERMMLLKLPEIVTVSVNEVIPGWALAEASDQFWGRYNAGGAAAELLGRIAPDLPKDCLGLSIENRTVACYWMEKARVEEGTLEQIKIVLDVLKEDFCQRLIQSPESQSNANK